MCAIYKSFVDQLNLELKLNKQIEVIDVSDYYNYGILLDERFRFFKKEINGAYPILFIDGAWKFGTNSLTEAEAWLRAKLDKNFLFHQHNPDMFKKNCEFIKEGVLKGRVVCSPN